MLTSYFKSPSTIAQYRAGRAGPYLDRFVSWLANRGYKRVSIRRHVREVVHFATWATSGGLRRTAIDSSLLVTLRNYLTEQGLFREPSGNRNHIYQSACVFVLFVFWRRSVSSVRQLSTPRPVRQLCTWSSATG